MTGVRTVATRTAYPLGIAATFALFALLHALGAGLVASTYVPIVTAAVMVTLFEWLWPHRTEWRPDAGEIRVDVAFMTAIQLALPPLVAFLFTYLLIAPVASLDLPSSGIWPHDRPVWIQVVLMILVVDLLRYWLHRACHGTDALWRLHAVHHSVERLYWLNTGRFHPLEKALHMVMDSLPFLLLGVHELVLALYYVAYASNGFFQHSNIDLRYGPLNYVVGSAETHRWHHSRTLREANSNYGSTLIVWDLLFGTWFLPRDRGVRELGLSDPAYPRTFLGLLGAPFRRR